MGKKERFKGAPPELPALRRRELVARDVGEVFSEALQSLTVLAGPAECSRQHGHRPGSANGRSVAEVGRNDGFKALPKVHVPLQPGGMRIWTENASGMDSIHAPNSGHDSRRSLEHGANNDGVITKT